MESARERLVTPQAPAVEGASTNETAPIDAGKPPPQRSGMSKRRATRLVASALLGCGAAAVCGLGGICFATSGDDGAACGLYVDPVVRMMDRDQDGWRDAHRWVRFGNTICVVLAFALLQGLGWA